MTFADDVHKFCLFEDFSQKTDPRPSGNLQDKPSAAFGSDGVKCGANLLPRPRRYICCAQIPHGPAESSAMVLPENVALTGRCQLAQGLTDRRKADDVHQ